MKRVLIFAMLLSTSIISYGQFTPGKYVWTDPSGLSSIILQFSKSRFTQTNFSDIDSLTGTGYFIKDSKKLILFYDKVISDDSSGCQVIQVQDGMIGLEKKTSISMTIYDGENSFEPFNGASILLGYKQINSVQLFSDVKGKSEFIIWDTRVLNQLTILALGYDPVVLSLGDYQNKTVSLNCTLRIPKKGIIQKDYTEFTIEASSKNTLILLLGKERFEFTRIELE
jgi:hypothetical protein